MFMKIILENNFKKCKIDYVVLDLMFIIVEPSLQIINIDRLILITKMFKSSWP